MISEPTRVTPACSTILDHVIVNNRELVQQCGVIDCGFSDHLVTFCSRGLPRNFSIGSTVKKIRSLKSYSAELLRTELSKVDWSTVLLATDVDVCFSKFSRLFKGVIDMIAPVRDVRVKSKVSPWMNAHIMAGIKKRNELLSCFKRNKSDISLHAEYSCIRNQVQRDIKMAKANHFRDKMGQSEGDSGKLWGLLKSLGYSKSDCSSSKVVVEKDGVKIFDSLHVADLFNDFYSNVASKLVSLLPNPTGIFSSKSESFRQFYRTKIGLRDPFVLMPVSSHFIRKQLLSLNSKKAVGLDDISSLFLRDGADSIIAPVSHMINMSIMSQTVPSAFKQARVLPLYKKGSKLDVGNYRPVSVLSVLSKVLERAIHGQLSEYLKKRGLLYEHQSGFRGSFSTDTCLAGLSDFVRAEMGKGNLVGLVLLDLQKAFDTVDHAILLDKLKAMGVSDTSWFSSYLLGRSQCVEVDGVRSSFREVTCGVPQGSILGPLLFLVYINDMHRSVDCQLSLYADDSALIFSHSDPAIIAERLSHELSCSKKWLIDNKLSLHVGKTECILFGSSRKLKRAGSFAVSCDGMVVGQVSKVKYLGVTLDQDFKFKNHVTELIKKCAGRIGFLYRNSSFLDFDCRRIMCNSLIQPYLDYCCSTWYSSITKQLRDRLDVIQRRMVRFVLSKDSLYHVLGRIKHLRGPGPGQGCGAPMGPQNLSIDQYGIFSVNWFVLKIFFCLPFFSFPLLSFFFSPNLFFLISIQKHHLSAGPWARAQRAHRLIRHRVY